MFLLIVLSIFGLVTTFAKSETEYLKTLKPCELITTLEIAFFNPNGFAQNMTDMQERSLKSGGKKAQL